MLWLPKSGNYKLVSNVDLTAGTGFNADAFGTTVTANATTLLDGAVTEIISSSANVRDSWGMEISIMGTGTGSTNTRSCFDVLVGGATDDVLVSGLIGGFAGTSQEVGHRYFFPVHIPAGLRIAMTQAALRVNQTSQVVIVLYGGGIPPFRIGRKVETLGTQADNASGVGVSHSVNGAAATVNEIIASTASDYFAFIPGYQPGNTLVRDNIINIGIGAGASTEERIGTWYVHTDGVEGCAGPFPHSPVFRNVPAGTRMTLLCAGGTGTNDTGNNALIYAIR